jgi:hypothetical protein
VTLYKEEVEVLEEEEKTNYLVLEEEKKVKEGEDKDNKNWVGDGGGRREVRNSVKL